ncbi:MAG: dehydrogenase [Bacteroidetes bacterium RIFCSPLOWO2_12_FULL_37_12]|nr:MAG: dehydrogenase [Bacteroidetes bacterium RIFCSPLOWO2_12_FULL_37_12]
MKYDRKDFSDELLMKIYEELIIPRLIEGKFLRLLRMGKVSKWFSGIGQEAISVGSTLALSEDEYILPLHRNLGVFSCRKVPLNRLFSQFQGKMNGFTKGRDRSFHFGTKEHHIVGMISHLGPQLTVACGIGLAEKISQRKKLSLVYTGDGGASEGDFHEALNVAAVWDLPVIFMVENNGYALSTPSAIQNRIKSFTDKGPAYGMDAIQIDGNNVLEVYATVKKFAEQIRENPKPVLIDALTFRMKGHEEASGTKYVPQELFAQWAQKDPVVNYEEFLIQENVLKKEMADDIRSKINAQIDSAWNLSEAEPIRDSSQELELKDVYFPFIQEEKPPISGKKENLRFVDAIREGLWQCMEKHENLILMGQDIAEYGGVFKVTEGFLKQFGKERVRNTPLCESAILGTALGLSVSGFKSMVEMQFADFVSCGLNQIVNNLAKVHYRWGQNADVVIRMPTGAGTGAGPFHSQSNEAWFFHTPGLKIVYPSNPVDAKGLLISAIEDPNPVMYFEHKLLYRSISEEVPEDYYTIPIGKASLAMEGDELSIITYGYGVVWAKKIIAEKNISADILDLRSLLPWDKSAVSATVKKTGKVLILHEDCVTGGIGAEISAWITEHCFTFLDAPVMRVGSLDTPVPFASALEEDFLPEKRLRDAVEELRGY